MTDSTAIDLSDEELERHWREGALAAMRRRETQWRDSGYTFDWIDPEPTYVEATDWKHNCGIPDPESPVPSHLPLQPYWWRKSAGNRGLVLVRA